MTIIVLCAADSVDPMLPSLLQMFPCRGLHEQLVPVAGGKAVRAEAISTDDISGYIRGFDLMWVRTQYSVRNSLPDPPRCAVFLVGGLALVMITIVSDNLVGCKAVFGGKTRGVEN